MKGCGVEPGLESGKIEKLDGLFFLVAPRIRKAGSGYFHTGAYHVFKNLIIFL
jgi:hypothetical protein